VCAAALLFCPPPADALQPVTSIAPLPGSAQIDGTAPGAHGDATAVLLRSQAQADDKNEEDNDDDDDQALAASLGTLTTNAHTSIYRSTTYRALRRSAGQISVRAPPQ
jgi:hypothetical protein